MHSRRSQIWQRTIVEAKFVILQWQPYILQWQPDREPMKVQDSKVRDVCCRGSQRSETWFNPCRVLAQNARDHPKP